MPGANDVPRAEQLGAYRVAQDDLAREHALRDQQTEVRRIGVGQPAAVPFPDPERAHADAQLALGLLAAIGGQQLAELRIQFEQRASAAGGARPRDRGFHLRANANGFFSGATDGYSASER